MSHEIDLLPDVQKAVRKSRSTDFREVACLCLETISTKPDTKRSQLSLRLLALACICERNSLMAECQVLSFIALSVLHRKKLNAFRDWMILFSRYNANLKQNTKGN